MTRIYENWKSPRNLGQRRGSSTQNVVLVTNSCFVCTRARRLLIIRFSSQRNHKFQTTLPAQFRVLGTHACSLRVAIRSSDCASLMYSAQRCNSTHVSCKLNLDSTVDCLFALAVSWCLWVPLVSATTLHKKTPSMPEGVQQEPKLVNSLAYVHNRTLKSQYLLDSTS